MQKGKQEAIMEEIYEAKIKLPIGRKDCTVALTRNEDGTFKGEFTVLGSTAPITNGKIDEEGNYSGECSITTMLGTLEATTEGRVWDGKIEGVAKSRAGVMQIKSLELW
jgi:hypothetical protein